VWSAVHGYVETASVIAILNDVDRTTDDIVGLPLYRTQFKVRSTPASRFNNWAGSTTVFSLNLVVCGVY